MIASPDDLRERIQGALAHQRAKTVTVLSSLLAVEDDLGYIPPAAIEEVAGFTHSTVNDVWAVASFYTNFRFTPPGEHVVEVCWGPACHLLGARQLLRDVLDGLGLFGEGDTPDGKVTVKYSTCLGACSQGPVVHIDERMIGPRALGDPEDEAVLQRIVGMVAGLKDTTPQ